MSISVSGALHRTCAVTMDRAGVQKQRRRNHCRAAAFFLFSSLFSVPFSARRPWRSLYSFASGGAQMTGGDSHASAASAARAFSTCVARHDHALLLPFSSYWLSKLSPARRGVLRRPRSQQCSTRRAQAADKPGRRRRQRGAGERQDCGEQRSLRAKVSRHFAATREPFFLFVPLHS